VTVERVCVPLLALAVKVDAAVLDLVSVTGEPADGVCRLEPALIFTRGVNEVSDKIISKLCEENLLNLKRY